MRDLNGVYPPTQKHLHKQRPQRNRLGLQLSTTLNPKKLSFKRNELPNEQTSHREIQCKIASNAIKDLSGVPNQRASELSSSVSFDNNDLPGAICEVQVIKC